MQLLLIWKDHSRFFLLDPFLIPLFVQESDQNQGERSAVGLSRAINNNCILHSLRYRISNKQKLMKYYFQFDYYFLG